MTTENSDNIPKVLHTQPVDTGGNRVPDDLTSLVQDLSPTSKERTIFFLQSLRKNEAVVVLDDKGRPVIQYKDERSKKIWWDASAANMITKPRSDSDLQIKMDAFLELIDYLKKNKPPSGIVLDSTHVQSEFGQYREGIEFTRTNEVLGKGNSAGDIIVVKDKKTQAESALKTMMISVFRNDEIRAWVDLNETGIPPTLYCFKLDGNKIHIFMEKIDRGITLRDIIDTHMGNIWREDPSLVRPFSLYVFHGLLSAVHNMHQRGWTHRDLHPGNIMLQESEDVIQTRIIDFGLAEPISSKDGLTGIRSDLAEVIRKFTALYIYQEFDSEKDMRDNWTAKVQEMADQFQLSKDDKIELFNLIESALKVITVSDVPELRQNIADRIKFDTQSLSKKVARILFSKPDFKSLHPDFGDKVTKFDKLEIEMRKTKKTEKSSMKITESLQTGDTEITDEYVSHMMTFLKS